MIHGTPQIFHESRSIFIHVPKCAGTSIEKTLGGSQYGGHSFGRSIRDKFPKEWKRYYKFGIVRDPLTRFGSAYYYMKERGLSKVLANDKILLSKDINDYIQNYFLKDNVLHMWRQTDFVCDANEPIVDIYKYEELEKGWKEILMKLNQHYKPLPKMNKSKDYTFSYDNQSLEILYKYYERDFKLFGY